MMLVDSCWITDIQGNVTLLVLWFYVQFWQMIQDVQISGSPDVLFWRWMADIQYTSKSCYDTLFQGALVSRS
jgi:hypothetical protein